MAAVMHKTTLYLDDDLRRAITRLARKEGRSEAEVIREALRQRVFPKAVVRPRSIGSGRSGDPELASNDERILRTLIQRRRRRP
jgi:ribbon-helix-helix CopG family protein